MAVSFGFRTLIMMVVFVGVIGALFLLPIRLFIRQNAPSK
jgi:hypothetical protein